MIRHASVVTTDSRVIRTVLLTTLITFAGFSLFAGAVMAGSFKRTEIGAFGRQIDDLRQRLQIPGLSMVVLHNQKIVLARGFGYADIEKRRPARADTPYNIASLTKPIAAAILMKLVEDGRLDLDDRVADILKQAPFHYQGQTCSGYASACRKMRELQQVVPAYYAGFFKDYRCDTEPITVRHHFTHTAQGKPGSHFRYNGFLYGLLSKVAEERAAKAYRDLVAESITGPLNMTATLPNAHRGRRKSILQKRAKYYRLDQTGAFVRSSYETHLTAAAGMTSTVLDLAKFDMALDQNHLVSRTSKQQMFSAARSLNGRTLPYGLGWFVQTCRGVKLVWHHGYAPKAYSALYLKVPEKNLTLILLANSDGASAPFDLGAGNVLASPFAVAFLNRFADFKIGIPITASIKHVHEPAHAVSTYLDVEIEKSFWGSLPDDIDTIRVTGPEGDLPIRKDDFRYFPAIRTFWTRLPGAPASGAYTFRVTSANRLGTATDTQSEIRTIPLPDPHTFSPHEGAVLHSSSPTFAWQAVKGDTSYYYRLEIRKTSGARVYASDYEHDMFSSIVPHGVLKPGQAYCWRIRVTDGDDWINVQNRSHSQWRYFTTARPFEVIDRVPFNTVVYPGKNWQKISDPGLMGWSAAKLAAARAYADQIGSAAVMIVEDGIVVDAWGDVRRKLYIHSMRKPLMSALIGIHVAEGRIDLSKSMAELGIDDTEPSLSSTEKQATIADLIRSRSGIYHPALGEAPVMRAARPKRHSHAPGTFYYYNNWDFNAIGTIFEQETGEKIFEVFQRRIAQPLQMEDFSLNDCWYESGDESQHRYYGFRMSARDLARFGLLYLREGRWQEQQLVSADWVRESTATHSRICAYLGYGYMWGTSQNGGPYPNICIKDRTIGHSGLGVHFFRIIPARKLVIVHRVDTDKPGPYPYSSQLGRLLWLILDAAGETDIGDNPALAAAKGIRLSAGNYQKVLGKKAVTAWGETPPGLVERSAHVFTASLFPDGSLSVKGGLTYSGTWHLEQDEFCMTFDRGNKMRHYLVLDGKKLKFFNLDGTLDFTLQVISQ